eukprot:596917-Prorocentrum_minimum.AAC.1
MVSRFVCTCDTPLRDCVTMVSRFVCTCDTPLRDCVIMVACFVCTCDTPLRDCVTIVSRFAPDVPGRTVIGRRMWHIPIERLRSVCVVPGGAPRAGHAGGAVRRRP